MCHGLIHLLYNQKVLIDKITKLRADITQYISTSTKISNTTYSCCIIGVPHLLHNITKLCSQCTSIHDGLNKFYSLYMTAVVSIISRCGLTIEAPFKAIIPPKN